MPEADVFARLDGLYRRFLQQKAWQQAAETRAQAGSLARLKGRSDFFRIYFQEAIDLASEHNLSRLEISQRMTRFTLLLDLDLSGELLDQLRSELRCELLAGGPEVKGALAGKLEQYKSSALAAYDSLRQTPAEPLAPFIESLRLAREKAAAFSLAQLHGQMDDALQLLAAGQPATAELHERIRAAAAGARAETAKICESLHIDLLLLTANLLNKLQNPETAGDLFQTAEELSAALPEMQVKVYMAWADHWDRRGKLQRATHYATKAVQASTHLGFAALKSQAAVQLGQLLARSSGGQAAPCVLPGLGATDRVMKILDSAHHALLDRRFEDALNETGKALEEASSPRLRRAVLRERSLALFELGRFADAEKDLDTCLALLTTELSSDESVAAGAFDHRILEEENLLLMKALLRAKAGRSAESWAVAEQGRSRRLKREIALTSHPGESPQDSAFEAIRPWLHNRRAAIVAFAATPWGTLALTAGPEEFEPEARILDQFPVRELKRLLVDTLNPDNPGSEEWTRVILDKIPELSAGLIHPLSARLREITRDAHVLYVIPDSFLYYAPFAAMTLAAAPGSAMLVDLCPLALISSTAILPWCASHATGSDSRRYLGVAAGSAGIHFSDHLRQVAAAPWPAPGLELRDEDATPARVSAEAPQYPVLYFSCHGAVSNDARDLMAASQLELANKSHLTARDVSTWKLHADLVFLNACQAGRFRLQARSDVNGFVRAFLIAGASSLIAPSIHVDPKMAGDLAAAFFKAWLAGASKAAALRTAQVTLRQQYPLEKGWAAYCLFGDSL